MADQKNKERLLQSQEKYYKNLPADFNYLKQFGYHIYKELGRGGYGVVYKAHRIINSQPDKSRKLAIKINFMTVTPELIYSEIGFLSLVKGKPGFPQLIDLFIFDNKVHIITEFIRHKPFIVSDYLIFVPNLRQMQSGRRAFFLPASGLLVHSLCLWLRPRCRIALSARHASAFLVMKEI